MSYMATALSQELRPTCPKCGTSASAYYHVPGDGCWDCRRPHYPRLDDRRDDRDDAPPPAVRVPIVLRVRPNPRPTRRRRRDWTH